MFQRSVVWRAWLRHRNESDHNARLRQFFEIIEAHPENCWDALEPAFRADYQDVMEEIVGVIIRSDDPLVIYNCFQFADLTNPREVAIIDKFIQDCDAERHRCTLDFLSAFKACEPAFRRRKLLDRFASHNGSEMVKP